MEVGGGESERSRGGRGGCYIALMKCIGQEENMLVQAMYGRAGPATTVTLKINK